VKASTPPIQIADSKSESRSAVSGKALWSPRPKQVSSILLDSSLSNRIDRTKKTAGWGSWWVWGLARPFAIGTILGRCPALVSPAVGETEPALSGAEGAGVFIPRDEPYRHPKPPLPPSGIYSSLLWPW